MFSVHKSQADQIKENGRQLLPVHRLNKIQFTDITVAFWTEQFYETFYLGAISLTVFLVHSQGAQCFECQRSR
jgi:hypothetical protein